MKTIKTVTYVAPMIVGLLLFLWLLRALLERRDEDINDVVIAPAPMRPEVRG